MEDKFIEESLREATETLNKTFEESKEKFKSTEEFKKEFFQKAKDQDNGQKKPAADVVVKKRRFWRWWLAAAATIAVVCVGIAEYGRRLQGVFYTMARHLEDDMFHSMSRLTYGPTGAGRQDSDMNYSPSISHANGRHNGTVVKSGVEYFDADSGRGHDSAFSPQKYGTPAAARPMVNEAPVIPSRHEFNTEEYRHYDENPFLAVKDSPLSTFGADVDTASYTNMRRMVMNNDRIPPADAIRIEEFLNYFTYTYSQPAGDAVLKPNFEMMDTPWKAGHKLLLVGLQAKDIPEDQLPPSNFVFLVDNSGSMMNSLPLVKDAMKGLADKIRPIDSVSLITYSGSVQVLLEKSSDRAAIMTAVNSLEASGCTNGGQAIQTAYAMAHKHFRANGNNRIVLITDGDFNMGLSSESELVGLVEQERHSAIYLSVIGCGMGNFKDNKLKMLANKGNGNYSYLDSKYEARHVLAEELSGKMYTLAKDVKFQIEFNPSQIHSYRLLGYEMRKMAARDFKDDTKDSGEMGVGHQVTALYELVMADADDAVKAEVQGTVDALKYTRNAAADSAALLTFKLRYQQPDGKGSAVQTDIELDKVPAATENIQWASAVAECALLMRNSPFKGNASYSQLLERARLAMGRDADGKRAEFLTIARRAAEMTR